MLKKNKKTAATTTTDEATSEDDARNKKNANTGTKKGDGLEMIKLTVTGRSAPTSPVTSSTSTTNRNLKSTTEPQQSGLYFSDGRRKIDYVLSYEMRNDPGGKKAARRNEFERNLRKRGLELEVDDTKSDVCFVKIYAPWDVLAAQAELLKIKMPIKKNDMREKEKGKITDCLDLCCANINCLKNDDELKEDDYFTAVFNRQLEDQFIITNKETFFKDSERSRMVYDILIRTSFDSSFADRVGINQLTNRGIYNGAFPLHDAFRSETVIDENGEPKVKSTPRQMLYNAWAKPCTFYKFQPLDLVRRYFGEKIAIYFAWLGFYTKTLFPAAIVGVLCIIYGAFSLSSDIPSNDICNQTGVGTVIMCPSCDFQCSTWPLGSSCLYSRITHVFDNWFTVVFAACMAIWATLFLEGWKRYQATLAWDWDLVDFEMEEEMIRPEFEFAVKTKEKNPVTQQWEPFLPMNQRIWRLIGSGVTVAFFLSMVCVFVFGVIVYRLIMDNLLKKDHTWRPWASLLTSASGAFINLICIIILDKFYQSLAWKLTNWEYPRTQSDFEDSYTFKVFMFQFINFNSSLFYIAFFKGRFSTVPNDNSTYIFGYPQEACDPAGCMVELVIQLAVIMVGKQFLSNCMEILFPIATNMWRRMSRRDWGMKSRMEEDYELNAVTPLHLFDEYLEMVIQFGFVTLFVPAFPLAPLFALLNNIAEIKLDAYKLVVAYRRPMPARAQNLGIWYDILDAVSKLAVLCNACVIAFTSDFVQRLVYQIAYSVDNSLHGYMENKLTFYDARPWCENNDKHNVTDMCQMGFCRFMDYRNPPCDLLSELNPNQTYFQCDPQAKYSYSIKWWHIFAAKLAFVLIFEHCVFLIKGTVAYLIPDVPHSIRVQMQRESYLAKRAFYEHEIKKHSDEKRRQSKPDLTSNEKTDKTLQDQKKAMAEKVARSMAGKMAKKSTTVAESNDNETGTV